MRCVIFIIIIAVVFAVPVQGAAEESIVTKEPVRMRGQDAPVDEEESGYYTEEEVNEVTSKLLDSLELDEIDLIVKDMLANNNLSFSDMVKKLVSGEMELDTVYLLELLGEIFVSEFLAQKEIVLQLLLLIFISALILNLSHLFENGQMNNISFYMVYLMVFVLLMKSFQGLLGQVESVISGTSSFMKIITPAYFLAITAANGAVTASGYYQIVLITITLVQWILLKVVVPGVQMYVVLGIVNYLSGDDYLSKMAELLKTIIIWVIKSVTAVVVGLQVLQKMVAPAIDMVKRGVIGKTISVIPGIGNVLDSVTEMAVGCAVLVRNCMGAAALAVLIIFGLGPTIQIGLTTILYRLVAAVTQPVAEKRFIKALTVMAEGSGLLLRILITAEILFLLTIAIVAAGGVG